VLDHLLRKYRAVSLIHCTTKQNKVREIRTLHGWAWLHMPVIQALGRLKQEDFKFEDSLGYIARHCLKETKQNKNVLLEIVTVQEIILFP
jgi:hypothetical protein